MGMVTTSSCLPTTSEILKSKFEGVSRRRRRRKEEEEEEEEEEKEEEEEHAQSTN
jgi:hypothetical protein